MLWLFMIVAVVSVLHASYKYFHERAQSRSALGKSARMLALAYEPGTRFLVRPALSGRIKGFGVTATAVQRSRGVPRQVQIVVDGAGRVPAWLSAENAKREGTLRKLVGSDDVEIEDPAFDGEVYLRGRDDALPALMGIDARRKLRALVGQNGLVSDGAVRLFLMDDVNEPTRIAEAIELAVSVAEVLSVPASGIPAALARNTTDDPIADVRLRNLTLLVQQHRGDALVEPTCRAAQKDVDPRIKILAARQLAGDGAATLEAVVRSASASDALRATALNALSVVVSPERLAPLLEVLIEGWHVETRRAAIRAAGRTGDTSFVPLVLSAVMRADADTAVEAARALEALGSQEAEETLCRLLSDEHAAVREAAARALGVVGGRLAVEPLMACAARDGEAAVAKAARTATTRIQAHLGEAEAGALTLVGPEAEEGRLSLARDRGDEVGALALVAEADDPPDEAS